MLFQEAELNFTSYMKCVSVINFPLLGLLGTWYFIKIVIANPQLTINFVTISFFAAMY